MFTGLHAPEAGSMPQLLTVRVIVALKATLPVRPLVELVRIELAVADTEYDGVGDRWVPFSIDGVGRHSLPCTLTFSRQ